MIGGGRSTRVFLLDDEPVVLRALEEALAEVPGLSLCSSPLWSQIATPLIRSGAEPAVLVSDLDLPGIRGADFCQIVRKHNPAVKIIIFSGRSQEAPSGLADEVIDKASGVPAVVAAVRRLARALGPAAAAPGTKGGRVLVVEDEPKALEVECLALRRAGFEVEGVATEAEAVKALDRCDAVLSDVRLGAGGSGLGVLAAAKKRKPPLPVVLISAFGNAETLRAALSLRCDEFLDKPIDPGTLVGAVRRALAARGSTTAEGARRP